MFAVIMVILLTKLQEDEFGDRNGDFDEDNAARAHVCLGNRYFLCLIFHLNMVLVWHGACGLIEDYPPHGVGLPVWESCWLPSFIVI